MSVNELLSKAEIYREEISRFLRDLISIQSFSAQEHDVVQRIKLEMEKVGFDEVIVDGLGNVIGRIGNGSKVIAMDAHIDTVEVGNAKLWKVDPFKGDLRDGVIYGRGASDQKAGMAAMVYGAKLMKEEGLLGDFTLYVTGTVMEEDCDGLCWRYIIQEDLIRPDYVVITEPTNLNVYRGHRGRMELQVRTTGLSCHASAPERGVNAIYKMAVIIKEIERLNERLREDPFLGKGSIAVTQIFFKSPSQNAVADECTIQLDRRLTAGETKQSVIQEIEEAIAMAEQEAEIVELFYDRASYTGLRYPVEKYFPTWVMNEDDEIVRKTVNTYREIFGEKPIVDKWTFSTNGISTAGVFSIPTIGFGPANEVFAHSPNDQCPEDHLVKAAAMYALLPLRLSE